MLPASDAYPIPVLPIPSMFAPRAEAPTPVLKSPVVLLSSEVCPTGYLSHHLC